MLLLLVDHKRLNVVFGIESICQAFLLEIILINGYIEDVMRFELLLLHAFPKQSFYFVAAIGFLVA